MTLGRREFLAWAAASAVLGCAGPEPLPKAPTGIRAVAFDGFPIFDPRPVFGKAKAMLGERAPEFVRVWRGKLFEYQWLRGYAGHYRDFLAINDDALRFAARVTGSELSAEQRAALTRGFLELRPWPDVTARLSELRERGVRLAFLSNMTPDMLARGIEGGGLEGVFEHVLSTDSIQAFKPSPAAYRLAVEAFGLPASQIAFAAFAGWDAAGASWFGFPTVWVNRLGFPREELGADLVEGADLGALVDFVAARS